MKLKVDEDKDEVEAILYEIELKVYQTKGFIILKMIKGKEERIKQALSENIDDRSWCQANSI